MAAWLPRFNAIGEGLSLAPDKHTPLFEKTDDGLALPHPWCMGFLRAMQLRFDKWQPLLVIPAIRDFWMPQRLKQASRQA